MRFFAGLPWYVAPVRRLGAELGGGLHLPVNEFFGWVGILSVQGFSPALMYPMGKLYWQLMEPSGYVSYSEVGISGERELTMADGPHAFVGRTV